MNLQPLYEVKARLEQAAIAGTGLLSEDFRLARAAEALKPMAAASPVFAKIDKGLQALLTAPAGERGGLLLDLLAVVDAVAYTQAQTGAAGEWSALPTGGGVHRQLSYGQLNPLLTALTTTGGGRMEIVQDAWQNHPEWFSDYRVLPAVIRGLGDSYSEMADQNARILCGMGEQVIPLLKQGFQPAGKKDMARRVQVIDRVAGASENEWYTEQLTGAKKEVRETLIFALRHDAANAPLLITLCGKEKSNCWEAAHWALAKTEAPDARTYWEDFARREPASAARFMQYSDTRTAAQITAEWFIRRTAELAQDGGKTFSDGTYTLLGNLRFALEGKTGAEICGAFRHAASLGTALDRDAQLERNGHTKAEPALFWCYGASTAASSKRHFSGAIAYTLMKSIQFTRDSGLCALAQELYEQYGGYWASPALCGALMTQDSETAYRCAYDMLHPGFRLFDKRQKLDPQVLMRDVMWALCWNGNTEQYEYMVYQTDPATTVIRDTNPQHPALAAPLDPRWYSLLMEVQGTEQYIMNILRPLNDPIMESVGKYLYHKATHSDGYISSTRYIGALKKCGWQDWGDFFVKCAKAWGEVPYYNVSSILNALPLSGKQKAAQLREVTKLIEEKKLRARSNFWPKPQLERQLEEWESEPDTGGNGA